MKEKQNNIIERLNDILSNLPKSQEILKIDSSVSKSKKNIDFDDLDPNEQILLTSKKLDNDLKSDNIKLRKLLSKWTMGIVTGWLTLVIFILIFNDNCINLKSEVIITLLGTTTLNVLGLMYIVLKDLFPSKNN